MTDPLTETKRAQRFAADPRRSAFVSANAGSGKTRVLTNRVARLLLDGADPSTILCITFTKAAAAEMAGRLFALLGDWALLGDSTLAAALADLDGSGRIADAAELARARRLFAQALETPGGLKIQTIHSFCETVLRRFPLEAGVPPGFAVIEELEAASLKSECVADAAAAADGRVAAAFTRLLERRSASALRALLEQCLGERRKFGRAMEAGWEAAAAEARDALGADADPETIVDGFLSGLSHERLAAACAALEKSGGNPQRHCAPLLRAYLNAEDRDRRFDALKHLFFNSHDAPRESFGTKATQAIDPTTEPFLKNLQRQFLPVFDRFCAAQAAADTQALYLVLERCFAFYAHAKAARAVLDFDDLIERTGRLFESQGGAAWVLYKLDQGLAHILLDEAQDTGPEAWNVIERPLAEFFAGLGAHHAPRTFFAVGDRKQSIYSFQGADAALFSEKEAALGKKIAAAQDFASVPLDASFRSTAPILRFVDALFAPREVAENVSDRFPLRHVCTRLGEAGLVELWPLVERPEKPPLVPWTAPLDCIPADSALKKLAAEVARTIAGWIRRGETLESQGRAVRPGDVMILVQNRGPLFLEMIGALGREGVPVAGADRFRLIEDQGVLDLLSYARAALFEGDDLALAETLKSPFFDFDEENLFDLAAGRADPRLWRALGSRRDERPEWRRAFEEIAEARRVGRAEGGVAFFAHVLETGAPSGWRRLMRRLGEPCREPIEEFLRQAHDFERRKPRSLRLFVSAIERSQAEVSREASEAGETVRVMTVHKAKGLEAEIVFLLDAHRHPPLSNGCDLAAVDGADGRQHPVLAAGDARRAGAVAAAIETAKRRARDEYRRQLYVAATRARDRLYICGHQIGRSGDPNSKAPADRSWHALAVDAFAALASETVPAGQRFGRPALRLACPQMSAPRRADRRTAAVFAEAIASLSHPPPPETRAPIRSPSALSAPTDAAYSPARGGDAYRRGRLLHLLLQQLPDIAPSDRRAAAARMLERHARDLDADARRALVEEAMRVLEHPDMAPAFAPGSLAEVGVAGRPRGSNMALSGRIDRLAICDDRILIVDYKTNRPPPQRVEDTPLAYLAQMAAYRGLLQEVYPERRIAAALLWTFDCRLMMLPDEALDRAHSLTLA
jgi:ATP-dependent helicase/nuclease subunit A